VVAQFRLIGRAEAVGGEEWRLPARAQVAADAARGLGQVVVAVGDAAAPQADQAAQCPAIDDESRPGS
jgi:hypothetical protein